MCESCGFREFRRTHFGVRGSPAQRHISHKKGRKKGPAKRGISEVSLPLPRLSSADQLSKCTPLNRLFRQAQGASFWEMRLLSRHFGNKLRNRQFSGSQCPALYIRQASGGVPIRNLRCGRLHEAHRACACLSSAPGGRLNKRFRLDAGTAATAKGEEMGSKVASSSRTPWIGLWDPCENSRFKPKDWNTFYGLNTKVPTQCFQCLKCTPCTKSVDGHDTGDHLEGPR